MRRFQRHSLDPSYNKSRAPAEADAQILNATHTRGVLGATSNASDDAGSLATEKDPTGPSH
jgi:hypothetical protein